jgi:DNA-binding MarR family transcriptional regulator
VEETFGRLLRTVQQARSKVMDVGASYGVTASQVSVLGAVAHTPGIDQRGVSAATFIDKSTVASVVTKLVERGLLVSSRNGADGRRDELVATAEAVDLVYVTSIALLGGDEAMLAVLPASQRRRFLRLLRQVAYADRHDPPAVYVVPSPDGVRPPLEVPWGLGRSLRGCLQRHTRLWTERFGSLVTPVQYLALKALDHPYEIDQRTLGSSIVLGKASLTEMLDRLQRNGLVAKFRDPADGRRRILELTDSGRVLLSIVDSLAPEVDAAFLSPLPPGQRQFFTKALCRLAVASRTQSTLAER